MIGPRLNGDRQPCSERKTLIKLSIPGVSCESIQNH